MTLFVIRDVPDALPHGARVVFPEIVLKVKFVFLFGNFDAKQTSSCLLIGLPVS